MAAKKNTTPQMTYTELTERFVAAAQEINTLMPLIPAALVPQKELKSMRATVKDWTDQVQVEVTDIAVRLGEATAAYDKPAAEEPASKPAAKKPAARKPAAAKTATEKPAAKRSGGKRQPAAA